KYQGKGYRFVAFSYMAHACKSTEKEFKRANRYLHTFAEYARELLFETKPPILIVKSYGGGGGRSIAGSYTHASKMLINHLGSGLGTVGHEMSHALMFADWQGKKRPNGWFQEGLGALMENSLRDRAGTFIGIGYGHWRFPSLGKRMEEGTQPPLREHMQARGVTNNSYRQGRWILTYLLYKGLLKKFYDKFRETSNRDSSGIYALEKVTRKSLDKFEKEWVEWSKGMKVEAHVVDGKKVFPVLGILAREKSKGLEIVIASPSSVADRAGMKAGDVIVKAGNAKIRTMKELLQVLVKKNEGSKLKIQYLRSGKKETVTVKLDQFIEG
ncbi:MAG: PDZ domain-containing protein, partial [Planctomycetota bacterium]